MILRLSATTFSRPSRWRGIVWVLLGLVLVGLLGGFALASRRFAQGEANYRTIAICISVVAGGVYLVAVMLPPPQLSRTGWLWIVAVGIALRVFGCSSPAIFSSDHKRYLWDGAVVANGGNPYRYSPQKAAAADLPDGEIGALAEQGREVLAQINHPHLRTIYPPFAQGLFAVAHWLTPFDITGWLIVLACFDAMTIVALLGVLRAAKLPLTFLSIYLWNPLVVIETYTSGHLDLICAAMVILFLWGLHRRRAMIAGAALALAAGIRVWPILLVFFLISAFRADRRRLAVGMSVFLAVLAPMAALFFQAAGAGDSGLTAYARAWEANAWAFRVFSGIGRWVVEKLGIAFDGGIVVRVAIGVVLLAIAIRVAARAGQNPRTLRWGVGNVLLVLLLVCPALYPWYYVPVVALAAMVPRLALLVWTLLLPLTYIPVDGRYTWFLPAVVHVPVWVLLLIEWMRSVAHGVRGPRLKTGI